MDLLISVLAKMLENETAVVTFPGLSLSVKELVEMKCFDTLLKIKAVIEDDSLDDPECFKRVERIVCAFEELGSGGGSRHDFG